MKSASSKRRIYVYYYPQKIKDIEKSLAFIVTPEEKTVRVRISRAKNKDQVEQFRNVFARILTIY